MTICYNLDVGITLGGLVVVAEWLRRQTRNLLGYPRVDSNPAYYNR